MALQRLGPIRVENPAIREPIFPADAFVPALRTTVRAKVSLYDGYERLVSAETLTIFIEREDTHERLASFSDRNYHLAHVVLAGWRHILGTEGRDRPTETVVDGVTPLRIGIEIGSGPIAALEVTIEYTAADEADEALV